MNDQTENQDRNTSPQLETGTPPTTEARPRKRRQPSAEELSDRQIKKWAELLETIVLTMATLAAVWAGFQAGQWSSIQTTNNVDAGALRIRAAQTASRAGQLQMVDIGLFTDWVNATGRGEERLADFYEQRFRDEFKPAFTAWLATSPLSNVDAPASPFDMSEYHLALFDESERLSTEAQSLDNAAVEAGNTGDRYTLATVILAGALLLAGLASRFQWEELRAVVVGASLVVLLYCVITLIRLPTA